MTARQKEYIITEKQLKELSNYAFDGFIGEDETKKAWDVFYNIRSRQHTSAEKVLDDDKKPSCFGAFQYHGCIRYSCIWVDRCKQSQEDY